MDRLLDVCIDRQMAKWIDGRRTDLGNDEYHPSTVYARISSRIQKTGTKLLDLQYVKKKLCCIISNILLSNLIFQKIIQQLN